MVAVARFTTIMKNAKKKHAIEERWIGFRISENPEYQSHSRYQETARFLRDGWNAWDAWLPSNDYQDRSKFILLPN